MKCLNAAVLLSLVSLLVAAGCSKKSTYGYGAGGERLGGVMGTTSGESFQMLAAPDDFSAAASAPAPEPPARDALSPIDDRALPTSPNRLLIYNASIILVVDNIAATQRRITAMADGYGGFMQELSGNMIRVRIPATNLIKAVRDVEAMGEVTFEEIKADDVTEEMFDIDIRLKNLEQVHARLLALLEKSDRVKDMVEVERELQRVTEELELLKGRKRMLGESIAFSTLRVTLNSSTPQNTTPDSMPFAWINRLAQGLTEPVPPYTRERFGLVRWIGIDLPEDYIRFFHDGDTIRAMSADGVMIHVQRHDNYKGGSLEFWTKLARRNLVEQKAVAMKSEETIGIKDDQEIRVLDGIRIVAGRSFRYRLALGVDKDYVYSIEFWGLEDAFAGDAGKLDQTLKSIAF
jgi:hypothetical protein